MHYICCSMIETFMRTSSRSNASGAHWAMIERSRRPLTVLWAPFLLLLFLSEPQRVVQSALHLVLMSWGYMFGVPPSPSPPLSSSPHPGFPTPTVPPRRAPPDPAPLMSQQDIPGVSGLSLIISLLSLHLQLYQLSDRPPTCTQSNT